MSRQLNLLVTRGCTLKSGEIFSVNESVPSNITYEQLEQGITNGTYTLRPLSGKEYTGQIRERANTGVLADLVFTVAENRMTFSVPASVTKTWENVDATFFYDVFETDISTGEVAVAVHGKIAVSAAITQEI